MITPLAFCTNARLRPKQPDYEHNGLPFVFFTCISHKDAGNYPLCIIGTSLDQWPLKHEWFTKVSREWRQARFAGGVTQRIRESGDTIKTRFDVVKKSEPPPERLYPAFIDGFHECMYQDVGPLQDDAPLPQQGRVLPTCDVFAFNCSNESGRPFAGRNLAADPNTLNEGREMWQEMCRCWKCRYLHHYNINADANLAQESYRQTNFAANRSLMCAEDLVQFQCAAARQAHPVAGLQALPRQPLPLQ